MAVARTTMEVLAGPEARLQWDETIRNLFGAVEMTIPSRAGFSGKVNVSAFGEVAITSVVSSGEEAVRKAGHIAAHEKPSYVLAFVQKGAVAIEQAGRQCTAGPGSFVLFDLQRPYRYTHPDWSEVFSVKVPGAALRSRVANLEQRLIRLCAADRGIGRVLKDSLESLARESSAISDLVSASLANRIVDLVAVGVDAENDDLPLGESVTRSAIFRRALSYMDLHLGDMELDPARIAQATGISVRYLHRIFKEHTHSVGDMLRQRRLARSYEALVASPVAPIKDIAYRYGFRSHAHFCASFRREFDMSPSDVRQRRGVVS
jgi:AraC-like DNA-binding protein